MLAAIFSRRTLSCVVSRLPAALPRAATAAIARPLLTAPLALRPPSLAARLLHAAPVARTPLEEFIDPYEQDPDLPAPGAHTPHDARRRDTQTHLLDNRLTRRPTYFPQAGGGRPRRCG